MRIVFRVDSSYRIGSGHVMRSLNLADQIRQYFKEKSPKQPNQKNQIEFLSRDYPSNLNSLINQRSYLLHSLPLRDEHLLTTTEDSNTWLGCRAYNDLVDCYNVLTKFQRKGGSQARTMIDLLIIDHYGIDREWESQSRTILNPKKILVIDDLANRLHDCDFLLDQSAYLNNYNPYLKLFHETNNKQPQYLLGAEYALLHSSFLEARKKLKEQNKLVKNQVQRIQICFGGSDLGNQTIKVLEFLILNFSELLKSQRFDIIFGSQSSSFQQAKQLLKDHPNCHFYRAISIEKMAELLIQTDLVIGAGGISLYERCCLGVPSLVITIAENQVPNTRNLEKLGVISYLGSADHWTEHQLIKVLEQYLEPDSQLLIEQSQNCGKIINQNVLKENLDKIIFSC